MENAAASERKGLMPSVIDKIRINRINLGGDTSQLNAAFLAAETEAAAIGEYEDRCPGITKLAHQTFTARQEAICKKIHKSISDAVADERQLTEEMRVWLDDQLGYNKP